MEELPARQEEEVPRRGQLVPQVGRRAPSEAPHPVTSAHEQPVQVPRGRVPDPVHKSLKVPREELWLVSQGRHPLVELRLPLPQHRALRLEARAASAAAFEELDGLADEEDLLGQLEGDVAGDHLGAQAERPGKQREARYMFYYFF